MPHKDVYERARGWHGGCLTRAPGAHRLAVVIPRGVLDSVAIVETQLRGGSSLRVPMSPEEFRALGETKHAEYYDGMCIVNPPSRRHVVAVRRLARRLEDACPVGLAVYPDWGWRIGRQHLGTGRLRDPRIGSASLSSFGAMEAPASSRPSGSRVGVLTRSLRRSRL